MSRRNDLLGYLGLACLAGAVLVRLLVERSGTAALVLAVAGAALFLAYFFRAGREVQTFLSRRSTREGGNVLGVVLFVLGIAVLVNVLGARFRLSADLTGDKLFTLAPETVTALHRAPEPPKVWVFYPEGDPVTFALRRILDAARLADPSLTYKVVDPERDPVQASGFGIQDHATVVQVGDRHETFTGAEEQDFVAALIRAYRSRKARVAFLRGHGESHYRDGSPRGLRDGAEALVKRGYEVFGLSILEGGALRDSVDVLVVAGPEVPFTPVETDSVTAFMRAGGRVLLLLDPQYPVALDSVLAPAGFRYHPRFLSDPDMRDPQVVIPSDYSSHPVVRSLRQRLTAVVFRGVGSFDRSAGALPGLRQAELLRSGPRTTVAGESESVPRSRILAEAAQWSGGGKKLGRLVAVGDSDFATQSMFNVLGDGDLFLSSVQWLAENEDLIELRPRPHTDRPVILTRHQGRALMVVFVLLLPVAVIAAGTVVWWRRR